jgi:SET domain-containing protein
VNSDYENFVIVKPSEIHGNGIFTTVAIPCGNDVMLIEGEVISEEECIRREEEEENVYIFWNEDSYIDTEKTQKIKYLNHKCDFNCEVLETDNNGLKLVASRDIAAGEELTIDYGYDEIYEFCRCSLCA